MNDVAESPRARPRRNKTISKAVRRGLKDWAKATPEGAETLARKNLESYKEAEFGPKKDGPLDDVDIALDHIEEILASPLGKAWIDGDVIADSRIKMNGAAPKSPGIVAPLPRRKLIGTAPDQLTVVPPMMRSVQFKAGIFKVMLRMLVWELAVLNYYALVTWDAIRGKGSIKQRAYRLRRILESLGPTFIKLGQQLALRADMLPYEYCQELGKLLDKVKPFPTEQAIEAIERVTGRPLGETFAVFDPTPIGSASLACVYQAILHSGQKVAVKVRRPGIGTMLAADLAAMDWILILSEALTLAKPGSTKGWRYDMRNMLLEELNFWQEARATELFRTRARKMHARVVTAPKVFFEISGEDVMVTEFVNGVFLYEVMNAIDRKDEEALKQLTDRGIDHKKVAMNLMMAFNWETMEGLLFHADPHPANIVVKPDNTLVFIDFGSCGRFSSKTRRIYLQFYNHIVREDVGAMVDSSISMLEPLPPIDIDAFSKELEAVYWDWLYALKSKHAEWWERATGVIYMKITDISRRYQINMNLDTLRSFRATFLYDTIIYRLHDNLEFDREMLKYFRRVGAQARKRVKKQIGQRTRKGLADTDYMAIEDLMRMMGQIGSRLQQFLDTPRHSFGALVDKAAFGIKTVIQLAAVVIAIQALSTLGHWIYGKITGKAANPTHTLETFINHPLYQVFLFSVLLIVIRRVLMRLGEIDVKQ